jgi:hypothetical protein
LALLYRRYLKKILISGIIILLISVLIGLTITLTSRHLEANQSERDSGTKCKSYRALEEIAVSIYQSDPDGDEWLAKTKEAEIRRKQHKCSQVVID